jgi:hypothetical protein
MQLLNGQPPAALKIWRRLPGPTGLVWLKHSEQGLPELAPKLVPSYLHSKGYRKRSVCNRMAVALASQLLLTVRIA